MRPIFCGNFEYDARQSDLERLFGRYGKVDRVDMKSGFAFLYMEDERDAEDAIRALDRREFGRKGRRLRVEWTKQERGVRRPGGSRRSSANNRPSKTFGFEKLHGIEQALLSPAGNLFPSASEGYFPRLEIPSQKIDSHDLRVEAANSLHFEAQRRIEDPVYGCAGMISQLHQQIQRAETELAKVQAEITLKRSATISAQEIDHDHHHYDQLLEMESDLNNILLQGQSSVQQSHFGPSTKAPWQ